MKTKKQKTYSVEKLFEKDKIFSKETREVQEDFKKRIKKYYERKQKVLDYFMFAFMEETGLNPSEIAMVERRSGENSIYYFLPKYKDQKNWFSKLLERLKK